jgi:long-chain acyl-CoA synthetase
VGERNLAQQAERQLERHGDYDSLFFEGTWWSSGTLADRASRLATGLAEQGVRPGDRIVVLMANCPEVLTTYTAAWRAGITVTPLIFLVTEDELRHALVDSGAVAVITTAEFLPKVNAAVVGAPAVRFIVAPGGAPDGTSGPLPVLDFADLAAAEPGGIVDRADDDLAALLYTGGTTGRSKGVPLTHANLYWCGSSSHQASWGEGLTSSLLPLPLAHAYGLLVTCVGLHQEEPHQTFLMRWFTPTGWLDLAQQHKIRRSSLVPSMIQMLLSQPLESYDLSALDAVSSGAAPLAAESRQEFESRVPGVTVYEGYGCTESASIISSNPLGRRRVGSVGPCRPARTARSACARPVSCRATGTPRRSPRPRWPTVGCTPATSATWMPTATCSWWTARRT